MRQLITRIDDDLHARLKARAAADGRSVNSLVEEVLKREVPTLSRREQLRQRMRELGVLAEVPEPTGPVMSRDEVIESLRGDAGKAFLDALEDDRADR